MPITPGTQVQSRADQYHSAAKKMGVSLHNSDGTVNKENMKAIRDVIGPPTSPKTNMPAGAKNKFGGRLDMTA
jgi:hypothetical protein